MQLCCYSLLGSKVFSLAVYCYAKALALSSLQGLDSSLLTFRFHLLVTAVYLQVAENIIGFRIRFLLGLKFKLLGYSWVWLQIYNPWLDKFPFSLQLLGFFLRQWSLQFLGANCCMSSQPTVIARLFRFISAHIFSDLQWLFFKNPCNYIYLCFSRCW